MKYFKIITLAVGFVILSCKSETGNTGDDLKRTVLTEIDSVHLSNEYEFTKGNPATMHALDSILVIHSFESNHVFYNYNMNQGILSPGYINFGRGPNELLGPIASGITDNKLWVYDIILKKIFTLDTKRFQNLKKLESTLNSFPVKGNYYKVSLIDSLHFIANGVEEGHNEIIKVNLDNDQIAEGYGKTISESSPEEQAFRRAEQKLIFANGKQNKVVMAYRFSDKFKIIDNETDDFKIIRGEDGFKAEFTLVKNNAGGYSMVENQDTRRAFTEGYVSDSYIYLAYSGKRSVNPESYNSDIILVYDWKGEMVKRIQLDRPVLNFTIVQDKFIYAFDPSIGYIVKGAI